MGGKVIARKPGDEGADAHRSDDAAGGAFPGFLRADVRGHLVATDGEAGEQGADIAKFGDGDKPKAEEQPAVGRDGVAGERDDDAHEVLQEHTDVNEAEDRGRKRLDAILRRAFAQEAHGENDRGEREENMGGTVDDGFDPRGQRDEHAEAGAEDGERRVAGAAHQAEKFAQGERGDEGDEHEGTRGAEEPKRAGDDRPESDGAENAFGHGSGKERAES